MPRPSDPIPCDGINPDISILNSAPNFVRGKSLTPQYSNCHTYITLFYHLIETTLGNFQFRKAPVAARLRNHIGTTRKFSRSAAKQRERDPKVGNPITAHDPILTTTRALLAIQKM
jgi:hypothetical protein